MEVAHEVFEHSVALGRATQRDVIERLFDDGPERVCRPGRLPGYLPSNPRDMKAMLAVLVEAERCAVRTYTEICNMTFGKDHRTYDIALAILNVEVEPEAWFSEYRSEGPRATSAGASRGPRPTCGGSVGGFRLAGASGSRLPGERDSLRPDPVLLHRGQTRGALTGATASSLSMACALAPSGENYFPKNVYPADYPELPHQLKPLATHRVELRG